MTTARGLAWMMAVGILFAAFGATQAEATVLDQAPGDAAMVVVIKDPAAADAKLDDLIGKFMPQPPAAGDEDDPAAGPAKPKKGFIKKFQTEALASKTVLLKPNSPLVLLFAFPGEEAKEPFFTELVEVADFKKLVGELKADENGVYQVGEKLFVAQYGDLVLIDDNAEGVVFFKKQAPGLKLTPGEIELWNGADAFAVCNLAAVVKAYTPAYEKKHAELAEKARVAAANVPSGEAAPKSAVAATGSTETLSATDKKAADQSASELRTEEVGWKLAQQADWAALGIALDGGSVDVRFAVAPKPGSQLASYLEGHPPLGAKLSPDLPKTDCWMAVWYSYNPDKLGQAINDLIGYITKAMDSGTWEGKEGETAKAFIAKLPKMVKAYTTLAGGKGAIAATLDKGMLFNFMGTVAVKDEAAYRAQVEESYKLIQDLVALIKESAPADENMPKFGLSYDKDVQKAGELSLDRLKFTLEMPVKDEGTLGAPNPNALFKSLFGGNTFTVWEAFSAGYTCFQTGANPSHIEDLVKAAKAGGGLADDAAIKELRKHALADANAVEFISLSTYMNYIIWNVTSAMTGMPLPPAAPASSQNKVVYSLAAGHGRLAVEYYLPASEVQQLATTMQGFMQRGMAMQQGMQPKRKQPMPDDLDQ